MPGIVLQLARDIARLICRAAAAAAVRVSKRVYAVEVCVQATQQAELQSGDGVRGMVKGRGGGELPANNREDVFGGRSNDDNGTG